MIAQVEEQQVLKRLDELVEHWSFLSIITGAVVAGWVTVAGLMGAVALDMFCGFDGLGRGIVIALWGAISLTAFLLFMVRPLRYARTREGVARRLEQIFPQAGSDLINAVQLSSDRHSGSRVLRALAVRQAAHRAERVPLETAPQHLSVKDRYRLHMHTPRDLFAAVSVAVLLAIVGGVCHAEFPAWPNSVYRLFHPAGFVPTIGAARIVGVEPGDVELVSGSPLTITAQLENPSRKSFAAELVKIAEDGSQQRMSLVPASDHDRYSITLPKVTDPFTYRVEIGGTQTDHFAVKVFDPPAVESLSATYHYPAYLERAEETVELGDGTINVPQFTEVNLAIRTRDLVKSAQIDVGGTEYTGLVSPAEPLVRATFPVSQNTVYSIHLEDLHGYSNTDAVRYRIAVTPDSPPRAEIVRPATEITAAAGETLNLEMTAGDDHGLSLVELRSRRESDAPEQEQVVNAWKSFRDPKPARIPYAWTLPADLPEGSVLLYRVSVLDNRKVYDGANVVEPQSAMSLTHRVRIVDREQHLAARLQSLEAFRQQLWRIYKRQTEARTTVTPLTTVETVADESRQTVATVRDEQSAIQQSTREIAGGITAEQTLLLPYRTMLSNLADGRMQEAADLAARLPESTTVEDWRGGAAKLVDVQDDILDVLERLLEIARADTSRTLAEMEHRPGGDLPNDVAGKLQNLAERLKEFLEQQRRVIEASEDLAKKPVEDLTEEEQQKLRDLAAAEDEWSRFLTEQHGDFSHLPEQDYSNPSLLEELIEVATEIKMAEDALTQKAVEIAVPLEQLGAEMAEELTTNIEKWLPDTPDREKWSQEEPLTDAMREAPMAELPHELEDLVGDLMEDEEDLFDEMEDVSSSWADSIDKGAGWDAMDGPISNMSAKGVTGNRLPNTSEIGGRSGEGRQGKSSGEFVGDSAVGKGGRKTPSRLSPDPFEAGQVNDTSHDPVGGATGGGKESGQGGEGLEGPIPPPLQRELVRLSDKQATLRNRAETIRLQFKIANFNSDSLDDLIEKMRLVEQQLGGGFFRSALRRRDVTLEALADLRSQAAGETTVRSDTTAGVPEEIRRQILGNMEEPSPDGWEQLNKSYFERLANGK